jgi:serine/threonine-protein kinase
MRGTFLVMEYIEGETLRDLLNRTVTLEVAKAIWLMKQLCSAVAAAHKAGVIHRDLKPENIIMAEIGAGHVIAKLVDLGIAKLIESIHRCAARITDKSELLGTPAYMSPEQCITSKIDEYSDIYSLGIIFFEILIGDPPFLGSLASIMRKHNFEPVPKLRQLNDSIPLELEALIEKMLSKKKGDRPSLAEILAQLDLLDGESLMEAKPQASKVATFNDTLSYSNRQRIIS